MNVCRQTHTNCNCLTYMNEREAAAAGTRMTVNVNQYVDSTSLPPPGATPLPPPAFLPTPSDASTNYQNITFHIITSQTTLSPYYGTHYSGKIYEPHKKTLDKKIMCLGTVEGLCKFIRSQKQQQTLTKRKHK